MRKDAGSRINACPHNQTVYYRAAPAFVVVVAMVVAAHSSGIATRNRCHRISINLGKVDAGALRRRRVPRACTRRIEKQLNKHARRWLPAATAASVREELIKYNIIHKKNHDHFTNVTNHKSKFALVLASSAHWSDMATAIKARLTRLTLRATNVSCVPRRRKCTPVSG